MAADPSSLILKASNPTAGPVLSGEEPKAATSTVATTATAGTAGASQAKTSATTRAAIAAPVGATARAGSPETATGATTAGKRGVAPTGLIYGGGGDASISGPLFKKGEGERRGRGRENYQKKEKRTGRSRSEKGIEKAKTQSACTLPSRTKHSSQIKKRSLPSSPSGALSTPSPKPSSKKNKGLPEVGDMCHVNS